MMIEKTIPQVTKLGSEPLNGKNIHDDQGFSQLLQSALNNVNHTLNQANLAGLMLAQGEIDFHNAMIVTEKANLALQLTMAIRNKIVEAYQEVMRMQV